MGSIFDDGIVSLLAEETDLQVSGMTFTTEATFLQDVSQARPDVILLDEGRPLDSQRILELLRAIPTLATLQVIVARPDDNTIDVYEKRSLVLTQRDDLLALIRGSDDRS